METTKGLGNEKRAEGESERRTYKRPSAFTSVDSREAIVAADEVLEVFEFLTLIEVGHLLTISHLRRDEQ